MNKRNILHVGSVEEAKLFEDIVDFEGSSFFTCTDTSKTYELIDKHEIKLLLVSDEFISEVFIQKFRLHFSKGKVALVVYVKNRCVENAISMLTKGVNDCVYIEDDFLKMRLTKVLNDIEFIALSIEKSQIDYLTNMYNRRSFHDLATKLCSLSEYENTNLCCAMIDIDHFKNINDTYGHLIGDEVIKSISSLIRTHFRKNDLVGRYGGEEFVVLMHNVSPIKASELFEKLRKKIEDLHINTEQGDINATVSMGLYSGYCYDLLALQSRADELLYKAKSNGRNKLVCH